MALSKTMQELETLFDTLNKLYFASKLPKPMITIQSSPTAYGHCSTKKIWKAGCVGWYEINIGAETLNRPLANTAATMLHEMVHLHCLVNEIQDTCQGGRYHNGTFKKEAESRDLKIDYNRTIGYSLTTPTDALVKNLKDAGLKIRITCARENIYSRVAVTGTAGTAGAADTEPKRAKSLKYVCPVCGQFVRSTNDSLNIECGVCHVQMKA